MTEQKIVELVYQEFNVKIEKSGNEFILVSNDVSPKHDLVKEINKFIIELNKPILQSTLKQKYFKEKIDLLQKSYGSTLKEPLANYFRFDNERVLIDRSKSGLSTSLEILLTHEFADLN